jgi:hypothetical protein
MCKTNPPPSGQAGAGDKTFQNPTEPSRAREKRKTNPPRRIPATALSPRQLGAVRLLSRGRSVGAVAAEVGVTRQTIAQWKRQPRFRDELARVHAMLIAGTAATTRRAVPAPVSSPALAPSPARAPAPTPVPMPSARPAPSRADRVAFLEKLCRDAGRPLDATPDQWTTPLPGE